MLPVSTRDSPNLQPIKQSSQPDEARFNAIANGELRRHLQFSESRRLVLILLIVAILAALNVFRNLTDGQVMQGETFALRLALLGVLAAYAAALIYWLRRFNQQGRLMPSWVWVLGCVAESLAPTLAIAIVLASGRVEPIEAMRAPALLLYGVFMVLTVLRMRPWLCVLSGTVCAGGWVWLAVTRQDPSMLSEVTANWSYYLSYPLLLLITGVAAALVSFEVRKYFRVSLHEARSRHELELLQHEVDTARVIQRQLMPEKPLILAGYDIAGWSNPATEAAGDYYDWQVLPDGRVAVVIADVSGHGIGPAMLMAICRAYARAIVPSGTEIQTAFQRINSLLSTDVREGRFVTFAVAVVDLNSGGCELLSAGHAPIFHYQAAANSLEEHGGHGIPLGIDASHVYPRPLRLQVEPGDMLVMVTDGFYEQKRAGDREQFGLGRLRAGLIEQAGSTAATIIEEMATQVRSFAGETPQSDDMTALVVKRSRADG